MNRSAHGLPETAMPRLRLALMLGTIIALVQVTSALASPTDLQSAKSATARFNSLNQAIDAGYGLPPEGVPLHECIAAFDGSGAMGFHYVNGALLDTTLDPTQPEALVYAPDGHGNLKLVAVEYVVFQEPWMADQGTVMPELFGVEFMAVDAPNRYELPAFYALHAWIWQPNPAGTFESFNPDVSCP